MNTAQAKALPKTADGRLVVTMMTAPDGDSSFVSLVNKGANQRRILARKMEVIGEPGSPPVAPLDAGFTTSEAGPGATPGANPNWFLNMFRAIFARSSVSKIGGPVAARKYEEAVTFDAALAPVIVRDEMWKGFDALRESLYSILEDATVKDKAGKFGETLAQFSGWLLAVVDRIPAAKALDVARELKREGVAKEGRVLSTASTAKVVAAVEALAAAGVALQALLESATPVAKIENVEAEVNPTQILAIAAGAQTEAIRVRKELSPASTVPELEAVGAAAYDRVLKAYGGPAQPGMTPEAFAMQQRMQPDNGNAPDPLAKFNAALASLGTLVAKVDGIAATVAKMDEALNGKAAVGDVKATIGTLAVVAKQGEAIAKIVETVSKAMDLPAPSNANRDGKKDEKPNLLAGTALDFGKA